MNRQFVAEQMPALAALNRIDIANNVGDRNVRRATFRQSAHRDRPGDSRGILMQLDRLPAMRTDRMIGIIVDSEPA